MKLPKAMVEAISKLGNEQIRFVADTYGDLAKGAVRRRVIPIYKRIDTLLQDATTKVDCNAGCDFCCHYHVYVTPLEVFAIVEEVHTWTFARRGALLASLQAYVLKVRGLGSTRHEAMNISCSLLEDSKCTIYGIRPLACRRHQSVDRSICERAFQNPNTKELSPRDDHRTIVSSALETAHAEYHRFRRLDRDAYEFHAALLEALTDPACRTRWNEGRSAFVTVADRAQSVI